MRDAIATVLIIFQQLIYLHPCAGFRLSLSVSNRSPTLGETVKFTCTITYYEDPTSGRVKFTRNGYTVKTFQTTCSGSSNFGFSRSCGRSEDFTLTIYRVDRDDEGTWKCSRDFTSSNSIKLSVPYGPDRVSLDKSSPRTVNEFSSLTVKCSTSCSSCSFTWKRGLYTVAYTSTLRLSSIKRKDAGNYVCTAKNTQTGKYASSSTLTVKVLYRPVVTLKTPGFCWPYRVYVGQKYVRFTCSVKEANPPVSHYIWKHNYMTQGTRSSTYSLGTVSKSSRGTYSCAGVNSVGSSVSPASVQVEVQYPPTVSLPSKMTIIEEQVLSVTCSVDSNPAPTIRWTKKGDNSFSSSGSTLVIGNIQKHQEGTYVCTATNTISPCTGSAPASSPVSKEISVTVEYKHTYIQIEFTDLEINCTKYITQGDTNTAVFNWTGPDNFTFIGPILNIYNIRRNQTGKYNCTVTNIQTSTGIYPQPVIEEFTAIVHYPAVITSFTINSANDNITVSEYDQVTMRCQVDSNPRSKIQFHNSSSELPMDTKPFTFEHSWSAHCRQRGNYSCSANNGIGASSAGPIEVKIMCSPRQDGANVVHMKFVLSLGTNITLLVPFLAYPEPAITWRSNNTRRNLTSISSVRRVSDISFKAYLTFTDLQQEDFGIYTVQAVNEMGPSPEYTLELVLPTESPKPTGLVTGIVVAIVLVIVVALAGVVIFVVRRRIIGSRSRKITIQNEDSCHTRKSKRDKKRNIDKSISEDESHPTMNDAAGTDMYLPTYAELQKYDEMWTMSGNVLMKSETEQQPIMTTPTILNVKPVHGQQWNCVSALNSCR